MALVRPFSALRPVPETAAAVAAVPYDVVSRAEAAELAAGNPLNFLHVTRAEIDLQPDVDVYAEEVYQKAASNFRELRKSGSLVVEEYDSLYFYRLRRDDCEQTGLAACYSLDEYEKGLIKKHERTRPDKEDDRTRHILAVRAQTGIVFLVYRELDSITEVKERTCCRSPLIDVTAPDGVQHTLWKLEPNDQRIIIKAFSRVTSLYVADGHHRIASAARARAQLMRTQGSDTVAEANHVLAVAFPDSETRILPYNRAVTDLGGLSQGAFVTALKSRVPLVAGDESLPLKGRVGMYVGGRWYGLDLRPAVPDGADHFSSSLDVALLQEQIFEPILHILNPRTDPRMIFVGGVRGIGALEHLVDSGEAGVAFSMAAVTTEELLKVSDEGGMMPPKSTWFEPKLRDGLLVHLL